MLTALLCCVELAPQSPSSFVSYKIEKLSGSQVNRITFDENNAMYWNIGLSSKDAELCEKST